MSARSISTVTGFGPIAERILARSSSRKDWGLTAADVCPEGLVSIMVNAISWNDYTNITFWPHIRLDVIAISWLMC
jgi:hypothetical protein